MPELIRRDRAVREDEEDRLAPSATRSAASRGRVRAEDPDPFRTAFERDRDRIIHAKGFRRLKHKTQVFVFHEGDHYRTRLTHTLEVTQIGRALARALSLDEDLTEALALAHDLGHPPFGHAGERALDECLNGFGGFDHNAQALRIVTDLERRYAAFDGLNLSWETLEGLVKHNGPLVGRDGKAVGRYARHGVPAPIIATFLTSIAGVESGTSGIFDAARSAKKACRIAFDSVVTISASNASRSNFCPSSIGRFTAASTHSTIFGGAGKPRDSFATFFFASAKNVVTITGYSGVDPTAGLNGIDNNIYPRSRTFSAGLTVRL